MKKLVSLLSLLWFIELQAQHTLPALPYAFNALEPYIDEATMRIHYEKHHQAYINNLNKAIEGTDAAKLTIEQILENISSYSDAVRNNAGGHYNHSLFWSILTPKKNTQPSAHLQKAIDAQFGNLEELKKKITEQGMARFGSGWVWLIVNKDKKLEVISTPNQDNPLMDIAAVKGFPILGIDVWEHAYYLKYQNKRNDYLAQIWNIINWEEVSKRYEKVIPKNKFEEWTAIKEFHKVMSQTFHPSEEGILLPIKQRSQELLDKAKALKTSPIPAEFNTQEVKSKIDILIQKCEKVHSIVKKKGKDNEITSSLNDAHDAFHAIIGACDH